MNLYEFITPSDPISFKADNDQIAYRSSLNRFVQAAWDIANSIKLV